MGSDLPITGERTVPGVWHENYWFRRHEATYRLAARWCRGARVLDAGCGEGYGAAVLRRSGASRVIAADLDPWATSRVHHAYPLVSPVRTNLVAIPLRTASLDVVVSLQTVEHLWDQDAFVAECARVLRPGGVAVVSTPNRGTIPAGNPFHHRELDATELVALLERHLVVQQVLTLTHGPRLTAVEATHDELVGAQLAGPPETWPAWLRTTVPGVTVDDFVVAVGSVTDALDLIAVATRRSSPDGARPRNPTGGV